MDFQEYNSFFISDFNINGVTSLRLNVSASTKYNWLETPRLRCCLLLIKNCPGRFVLPDGRILTAQPGDIAIMSTGARYLLSFDVPEGEMTHPLLINFYLTDQNGQAPELNPGVLILRDAQDYWQDFQSAVRTYKSGSHPKLKAKVYAILSSLFPIADKDECCIEYINRNYTQKFSIPRLAEKCAMCETTYRKRFKKLTGLSPVKYINRLKVEKACQMLQDDDIHLQEISDFLNFYNLPYFFKVFQDIMGTTPMRYRQQFTGMQNEK